MKIKPPTTTPRGPRSAQRASASKKAFTLEPTAGAKGSSAATAPAKADAARQASAATPSTPTMPQALKDLELQRKRIDKLLAQAARGRDFSPQQLLRLQSTVYRYGQDLEVLSRVVDKTVGALKQVLNTQV
jgi:hypothetical protein